MISIIGLIISAFLFCLLLFKRRKDPADYILITWMAVTFVHIFLHYAQYSGLSYRYPQMLGLILPLPLLHPVLLYFYNLELTREEPLSWQKILLHLIPFFSLILLAIPFFIIPPEEKVNVFRHEGKGFEWYMLIQILLILAAGFIYTFASLWEIRKHRKRIQQKHFQY